MTTVTRARLRRLRFALLACVAAAVIAMGVLAGLTQLLMPWLQAHPQHVEHWLSAKLERPVHVGKVTGSWIGGGPVLALDNVQIGPSASGQAGLTIPRAELAFDLSAVVRRKRAMTEFRVTGLDLRLVQEAGAWHLKGLDIGPTERGGDAMFSLGALSALEINDLKLTVDDPASGFHVSLGAPVVRLLNQGQITRVLGRLRVGAATSPLLEFVADLDVNRKSGEIYVGGRDVDLAALADTSLPTGVQPVSGQGLVQLWVRINAAQVEDIRARFDLEQIILGSAAAVRMDASMSVAPRVAFARLAFVARWLRDDDGWTFDLADLLTSAASSVPAGRLSIERRGDATPTWRAAARTLPLQAVGDIAMLSGRTPDGLRRWLYQAHPRGTLDKGDLLWRSANDFDIETSAQGLGFASVGAVPGIERSDLDVTGDAGAILVHLPEQALRIDFPHEFRRPFVFSAFGGDVIAQKAANGWRLETDRIGFEGAGYGGELRGSVDLVADRRPSVDLYAHVDHADVVAAKLFWPMTTMAPQAIEWLDRALVDGHVVDGSAVLRGELADWPFHHNEGRFVARAELDDATLDYAPDWPRAEGIHAFANFINDGLYLEADAADALGNKIGQASASIEDYGPLVLDLSAKGEGSGANLLRFLRATPIGKTYREQLQDLSVGGRGIVEFKLRLPIHQIETLGLQGSVALSGANIDYPRFDLHFLEATGPLRFDQKGFAADELAVGFRDRKARLSLALGDYVDDSQHALEGTLSGVFPVTVVFADLPVLAPALGRFPGESQWTAQVSIDHSDSTAVASRLSLASDLVGTAISLPAPLTKSTAATLVFRGSVDLPFAGSAFKVRLGDRVGINGRVPGSSQGLAVRVGFGADVTAAPPAQGIAISGDLPMLDAGAWLDLIGPAGGAGSGGLVDTIDVDTRDFVLADHHFANMRLKLRSTTQTATLNLDSEALAGAVELPITDLATRGIDATFARIHWPDMPEDAPQSADIGTVAPGALPPLRLSVDDFRLGQASFGSAKFASHPISGGMQVDTLESHSPNVNMAANGTWSGSAQDNRSSLVIDLSAQSLGHMMDALGFPGLIDGGATKATIDASWSGAPTAFALDKLDGTLDVNVAEGRILDVEPGAGRLFGLFSLTEIPRRLSLDFSDFFKSGLSFNSISGKFRLEDGNAFTDGLRIKSPAAQIQISGRTGLRTKDYDQLMTVQPHAGVTLPIVGAIAAGPIGAAAGLVMQGILNKPLGKAIASRYSVTGSWAEPEIKRLPREKNANGEPESGSSKDLEEGERGTDNGKPALPAGVEPGPASGLH